MYYLAEDPTYVLGALGLAAAALLVTLRVTQQGKFLIWAGVLGAIAAAIFGFERYWVTDAERIEAVVYDLGDALRASDVARIQSHLDDRVTTGMGSQTNDAGLMMRLLFPLLERTHFDFVRISRLNSRVMGQARRGSAEFAVTATGVFQEGLVRQPLGSAGTEWSLGFREAAPGVWKVNRITAIKLPPEVAHHLFPGR
jgi:hypothetical protein